MKKLLILTVFQSKYDNKKLEFKRLTHQVEVIFIETCTFNKLVTV